MLLQCGPIEHGGEGHHLGAIGLIELDGAAAKVCLRRGGRGGRRATGGGQ